MHVIALVKVVADNEKEARARLKHALRDLIVAREIDYYCVLAAIHFEDPCLGHHTDNLVQVIEKQFREWHENSIKFVERRIKEWSDEDTEFAKYLREKLERMRKFEPTNESNFIVLGDVDIEPHGEKREDFIAMNWLEHKEWQYRLKEGWHRIWYFVIDYHW